jgi:3-methyladenine DNA glycosylase AlkC
MMRMLVSCDWAEHVLPIFERRSPKRVRHIPRSVVEAARQYFTNAISDNKMVKCPIGAKLQHEAFRAEKAASGYAGYAAELAADAALYIAKSLADRFVDTSTEVSDAAAGAFAWYDTDNTVFPDIETRQAKKDEEYIWQVRRLIAVIEAVQASKPRPPMEATP